MAQKTSMTKTQDRVRSSEVDGELTTTTADRDVAEFTRAFNGGNQAPQLMPLADLNAHPGNPATFTAFAIDPDGDNVTYSLINGPPGATMSAAGIFSWTPAWNQLGAWTITVKAADPGGLFDTRTCTITVGNLPPQLMPLNDANAHPGIAVTFTAFAIDPDGDIVTYSLVNPPAGATITGAGNFNWTPTWSQLGARTITVRATDPGGMSDSRSCTVTVCNQPPQMMPLANRAAHPNAAVNFTAFAIDPDGDNLTYSLVSQPAGATITGAGVFSWTPAWNQLGAWTISVRATDPGGLFDTATCTITVGNQAPTLMALLDRQVKVGHVLNFTAIANDPDGDPLTYCLVNPPAGATMSNTGNFSWTPAAGQEGAYTISVRVADPGNLSDMRSCTVTVTA